MGKNRLGDKVDKGKNMADKPKKEHIKKHDKIWAIVELSMGTVFLAVTILSAIAGSSVTGAMFWATALTYIGAIDPVIRLIKNKYNTNNTETKTDIDKEQ